jgi:hypothetical protein
MYPSPLSEKQMKKLSIRAFSKVHPQYSWLLIHTPAILTAHPPKINQLMPGRRSSTVHVGKLGSKEIRLVPRSWRWL